MWWKQPHDFPAQAHLGIGENHGKYVMIVGDGRNAEQIPACDQAAWFCRGRLGSKSVWSWSMAQATAINLTLPDGQGDIGVPCRQFLLGGVPSAREFPS